MPLSKEHWRALWGSNASGLAGWIVTVACVSMLIVVLYLYAVR